MKIKRRIKDKDKAMKMWGGIILSIALISTIPSGRACAEQGTVVYIERLFLEGKYEKVITEVDRAIAKEAFRKDELYYLKGLSLLKLDKFSQARDNFEYVAAKFPGSKRAFDASVGVGDSYFLDGRTEKALTSYTAIVTGYPDNENMALVYYRMADCYRKEGLADKAREFFEKAKRMSPLSVGAKEQAVFTPRNIPQAEARGYFSVQVGCFKNRKNAERLTAKLAGQGFDCFTEMPASGGDGLYRVKAGKFDSREEAAKLTARLSALKYKTKICAKDACE